MAEGAHREAEWTEWTTGGHKFVVPKHYSFVKEIGSGSYGVVCSANDNRETVNSDVAIKKVTEAFENRVMFTRTLREIKLLRLLKHPNIVSIHELMMPKKFLNWKDIYVVMELMESDLGKIIASPQPLSEDHVMHFTYYILEAVRYIHSCNVVHRDLKPGNILVNADCKVKICDFGLARALGPNPEPTQLTAYVATRWYRAPEVLLSNGSYSKALDMWSVGCIAAELVGPGGQRRALFPGRDCRDQLERICGVLGNATPEDIDSVPTARAQKYLRLLELIAGLLRFAPQRRLTVAEALRSKFFESIVALEEGGEGEDATMVERENTGQGVVDVRMDGGEGAAAGGDVISFEWEAALADGVQGEAATLRFQELMYEECRVYHPEAPSWQDFKSHR